MHVGWCCGGFLSCVFVRVLVFRYAVVMVSRHFGDYILKKVVNVLLFFLIKKHVIHGFKKT